MPPPLPSLALLLLLLSSAPLSALSGTLQPDCATSPPRPPNSSPSSSRPKSGAAASPSPSSSSEFSAAIQSALTLIRQLVSTVSTFSGAFSSDLRLSSAISDCLDLLDLSADELSSSLSPSHLLSGTGNRRSDLRSWLSAALGNQDTCRESLSGTSSLLASLVSSGLDSVSSFISQSLVQIVGSSAADQDGNKNNRRLLSSDRFPSWVRPADRRLLQAPASGGVTPDAVVAQDGSGNFTTVSEAIEMVPAQSEKRFVIYVKKGVYKENVEIKKKKWNVMIFGDGIDQTVISGSRNYIDGWTTFRTATFAVAGKGFIARDLTVENTAGPSKHQAVALRSDSDLSVYYRCAFRGYQDTLYAHSLRQFYRECIITGTVDFIFGNAAAVFQNSQILPRLPLPNQKNSVTAQGRKDPNQNTGFSLQFCNITADADLINSVNQSYTYLGRPWKEYSRTVIMQSYLGNAIRPEGWLAWQEDYALDTLYYAEYMNYGPGSGLASRVKWTGYHAINSSSQAVNFTVAQFIDGNMWIPSTGVKYTAGLMV